MVVKSVACVCLCLPGEFYGMDHDAYEHEVTDLCLEKSGHIPEQGTYESQSTYNPYNVHMGQMTVYR